MQCLRSIVKRPSLSDDINYQKRERQLGKFVTFVNVVAIIGTIIFMSLFIYWVAFDDRNKQERTKAVSIDPNDDAVLAYPYDSIDHFIKLSQKCKQISEVNTDLSTMHSSGYITVSKTEKDWTVMNVITLFQFLEKIVRKEATNGLTYFCSTTIGIPEIPCACVLQLKNNQTLWILDVHDKLNLEIRESMLTEYAFVKEKPFLFKNMYDGYLSKKIPLEAYLTFTSCTTKGDGLACKKSWRSFEKEDVFSWKRLVYFMDFDPKTYTSLHPSLGYFEST